MIFKFFKKKASIENLYEDIQALINKVENEHIIYNALLHALSKKHLRNRDYKEMANLKKYISNKINQQYNIPNPPE